MTNTRRGNNEGSIVKRADGRWEAKVSLGFRPDGTRIRKSVYGKTKTDVRNQMNAMIRDHAAGMPVDFKRQTVAQFLNAWLQDVVKGSVRPRTFNSYAQLTRDHLNPSLGHHQLSKLTTQHVQAMMNDKLASGLSPRTVQYMRSVLRRALGQVLRWGLVSRNVATLVDPPKLEHHEISFLSPTQAKTFLQAVKGDSLEALYGVSLTLGLRQGEALGLCWDDIHFETRTLAVRRSLQRIDRVLVLTDLKTKGSRRDIPIPTSVVQMLKEHRTRQLEERFAAAKWGNDWNLVFTRPDGTPFNQWNIVAQFKRHLKAAGLPDMRWHDLRHSCASIVLAGNIHTRTIMETLGHSQISTTMNTYSHVIPDLQRQAADRIDELFGT
jgi:integrase